MQENDFITQAADQCVMCGMCLPHCPTYQISQNEAESPRGRISLIKAFHENKLASSPAIQTHIQSCTGCMKCEQICPANVPYQKILDAGRAAYKPQLSFPFRLVQTISFALLTTAWGQKLISIGQTLASRLPGNNHFKNLLNVSKFKSQPKALPNDLHSTVTIFTGCTGRVFDKETLSAIEYVLSHLGYKTDCLKTSLCCGALAQHSGTPLKADQQCKTLQQTLKKKQIKSLISFASGCGRQLNQTLSGSIQHQDIMSWLKSISGIDALKLAPLNKRVLIHSPCTYKTTDLAAMHYLLDLIPGIEKIEFTDNLSCCGAGGGQLLFPEQSNTDLLNKKISRTKEINPDFIVSTNIGCSLYLKTGLQKNRMDIEVIHPVTLIARQLLH